MQIRNDKFRTHRLSSHKDIMKKKHQIFDHEYWNEISAKTYIRLANIAHLAFPDPSGVCRPPVFYGSISIC